MNYETLNVLIIVGIIAIILFILVLLYLILTLRKMQVASKKIDYFFEDASYKLEKLTPTIDSVVKLSNYLNVLDNYLENNTNSILNYILKNKINISKFEEYLKQNQNSFNLDINTNTQELDLDNSTKELNNNDK